MHIDLYSAPQAPMRRHAPTAMPRARERNFIYTGDQFIFTPSEPQGSCGRPPPPHPTPGFWHWLMHLFG